MFKEFVIHDSGKVDELLLNVFPFFFHLLSEGLILFIYFPFEKCVISYSS
jgi:hypothetical protein